MPSPELFQFGEFTLDVRERLLLRGDHAIRLSPKAFDLLVALVRQHGRLMTKGELLACVWPDSFVEAGILTVHISTLRRVLGGAGRPSSYIETVPGAGYRFIARVTAPADRVGVITHEPSRRIQVSELVGRGRSHLLSGSYLELPQAVAAFRGAMAIDPRCAAAHAGLALTHCAEAALRAVPYVEAYAKARTLALRALAVDSANADAQTALGTVLFLGEWEWEAAERSFCRALEVNPAHVEALLQYGSLMEARGRLDEGLCLKQRALERDSHSLAVFVQVAISYWHQRRYDDAIVWADRVLAIDPRHLLAAEFLLGVYWQLGDMDQMIDETLRRTRMAGLSEASLERTRRGCDEMKHAFASEGRIGVTRHILRHLPADGAVWLHRAVLHSATGDFDAAFDLVDRALNSRDPAVVHLAVAPQWDSLRSDPRFAERLKQMALA